MKPLLPVAVLALACASFAGCLGKGAAQEEPHRELPPGWDEPTPERSELAKVPFYRLTESTSFLAKGTSYARYVIKVEQPIEHAAVFFTTSNGYSDAPAPSVHDEGYHYEFMQIRPLGRTIEVLDVDAGSQFSQGTTGHTFTLTYVYGHGADYQYLAPFDGDPGDWTLEPGFYELVIATDEQLTVGINIDLGSGYWTTRYHPQELGVSRAALLQSFAEVVLSPLAPGESYRETVAGALNVFAGERLNLFVFADLIYDARGLGNAPAVALEAAGESRVRVGEDVVSERLAFTTLTSTREEAFAYAAVFNKPGPVTSDVVATVTFHEQVAIGTLRAVNLLAFAVVVKPLSWVEDLPEPASE